MHFLASFGGALSSSLFILLTGHVFIYHAFCLVGAIVAIPVVNTTKEAFVATFTLSNDHTHELIKLCSHNKFKVIPLGSLVTGHCVMHATLSTLIASIHYTKKKTI